jgi:hypothetical protein
VIARWPTRDWVALKKCASWRLHPHPGGRDLAHLPRPDGADPAFARAGSRGRPRAHTAVVADQQTLGGFQHFAHKTFAGLEDLTKSIHEAVMMLNAEYSRNLWVFPRSAA